MKRKIVTIVVAVLLLVGIVAIPAQADTPTPEDIEASIQAGIEWLVLQQNPDGSWPAPDIYQDVAYTGFAVVKLEDRAYELGYDSPFDEDYPYHQNVIDGLNFIFKEAGTLGPGTGICWEKLTTREVYSTGIAMMAIAASRTPDKTVDLDPIAYPLVGGKTYKYVLQENVTYYAYGQNADGGWRYYANYGGSDGSTTGYAVLGLRYAEAALYGFECDVSAVKPGLNNWINAIQCTAATSYFGGCGYTSACYWVNLLKTGNLLFEMSLVGDDKTAPRVQNAITYIANHWYDTTLAQGWGWNDPSGPAVAQYQAAYCLMKGLESMGIGVDEIPGVADWYLDLATVIVPQQTGGYWPSSYAYVNESGTGGAMVDKLLSTIWALLTLEKVSPPPPVYVVVDMPACACDDGYDIEVLYTVERFVVDGTLTVKEDGVEYDTVALDDFTGIAMATFSIAPDTPGFHTWTAELDVEPVGGGTPAHADDEATIKVCETPVVSGIPDQTAPFVTFDLDDYLTYTDGLAVTWEASDPGGDWTITIDGDNVVTVDPGEEDDPATITFIASVECCNGVVCSDSDDATFTPNLPPDCSWAEADNGCLWPPNHKFVDITIIGVTDPDGDPVTITITSITSDEPTASDKGSGGAKHAPDAIINEDGTVSVRAERSGDEDGRVYEISFTASDGRGGVCEGTVIVKVPHDQSDKDCPAVDSGQVYDATDIN